mmetsp:Transcript_24487/g.31156  ORF Transcript_24487/g.31156 Transcript_24487/m.31156 type:complete len:304 (-) Transcript_24487:52-963(-)
MNSPVVKHIHSVPVSKIGVVGDLTMINSTDSVEKAINVLGKKILSVPVMDKKSKQCLGLLDMIDIANFLNKVAPDVSLDADMLQSLEISGRAIALETVDNVLNASGRDPFVPAFEDSTGGILLDLFSKNIQRVPLADREGNLIGSVSQSDFIKYLSVHIVEGDMKTFANKTIAELGLTPKPVICATNCNTVLTAISLIVDNGISGVGVVDCDGKLVGNFSARDCVGIYRDQLPSFLKPVGEFLESHSPKSLKPITCSPNATISQVLNTLVESNVHHIYVVEDSKPISIVSTTDIMKCIRDYVE